jgi:hypothetical protein
VPLTRYVSLVDVVVLVVAAVVIALPPRLVTAEPPDRLDAATRNAMAFAEARVLAAPEDGKAAADLARRLGEAGQLDWAVQAAMISASDGARSPTRWRALLAASIGHADRLEVKDALELVNRTLAVCAEVGEAACPAWEQVRIEIYQRHLDAGIKSGIDARKDPRGFREAGEAALRSVRALGSGGTPPRP